jgi:hypothetical protein
MAKGKLTKDREYHGQTVSDKRQTISWQKGKWQKTDNIIAKVKLTKHRKYHGQREWYCLSLSISLWPCYCLAFVSFRLAMILSVFCQLHFGYDIVCLLSVSLWPWCCLSLVSFPLAMLLSVFCQFPVGHDIVCLLSVSLWPWCCLFFV